MMKNLTGSTSTWNVAPRAKTSRRHTSPTRFKFAQKTNPDGTASRKKVRCAIRDNTMVPGVEYDYEKTSAQTPSHTSLRLLVAVTAANVPLWSHGTSLAHTLKLTPIPTIGKL
jgi:hypothetical protein